MPTGTGLMDAPAQNANPEFADSEPAVQPRVRKPRSWVWRLVRIPVFVYIGLAAVLFSFQTRLIFPGAESQGQASAVVKPKPGEELVNLTTANGERAVALFGPALTPDGKPLPNAASRPTLLYFYGNGMCLHDTFSEFDSYRRLGLNVMIPEFLGYGMSQGKPREAGCYATADAAFEHLRTRKDVDPNRIIAGGWSLGGSVALDLASRKPVAGLIIFSTFTSMVDMSRRNFPFLPASILLLHRFDNLKKIGRVKCPILIGHGQRDQLVPYAMSERLYNAARSPIMRLTVDAAGHNDFYDIGGSHVFDAVRKYVGEVFPDGR